MKRDKVKRTLGHDSLFRLYDWVRMNKEAILRERPTRDQLADQACKALGVDVSKFSFARIFESLGIDYNPKRDGVISGAYPMKTRLARLEAKIDAIGFAVVELYREFGKKLPDPLSSLVASENGVATSLPRKIEH
jgi:hypothetical protein